MENTMPRKLTQEEAKNRCSKVGIKMIGIYMGLTTKIEFECPRCKRIFKTVPSSIFCGDTKSCGYCNRDEFSRQNKIRKLSQEEAKQKALSVGIKLVGPYINHAIKTTFECPLCNKLFQAPPNHIFNKHTTSCGCRHHQFSNEEAKKRALDVGVEMIGQYINSNIKIEFKCPLCQKIFKAQPHKIFSKHTKSCGCYVKITSSKSIKDPVIRQKMAQSRRKPNPGNSLAEKFPELAKEWHPTKNNDTPYDINYSCQDKRWWICNCGNEYEQKIGNRTQLNHGCPKCRQSHGEKQICLILEQYHIRYEQEKQFDDCRHKKRLRFDFYLPNHNNIQYIIEYNGEQHYALREKGIFSNKKNFNLIQKRDKIKVKYCKKNNITLIIIPYTEYDNIENILMKELNLIKND